MVSCSGKSFITLLHSSSFLQLHQNSRLDLGFWAPIHTRSHTLLPPLKAKQDSAISIITLKQETDDRGKNGRENELENGNDKQEDKGSDDEGWETELREGLNPLISLHRGLIRKGRHRKKHHEVRVTEEEEEEEEEEEGEEKEKEEQKNKLSGHTSTPADWAEEARKRAVLSLQSRNPAAAIYLEKKINNEIKKRKKKKKKMEVKGKNDKKEVVRSVLDGDKKDAKESSLRMIRNVEPVKKDVGLLEETECSNNDYDDINVKIGEYDSDVKIDDDDDGGDDEFNDIEGLLKATELYDWKYAHAETSNLNARKSNQNVEEREKLFNRRLVEANNASEVLEIVSQTNEKMGFTSLFTPFNVATALHRIAKHMEASGTHETERLAFARKRSMAELVARAMEVLSLCSAQGLANIAWALSKVGGSSLYFSEMDLIAQVALSKTSEFNAQNVANMSGAYASMRHVVPDLFTNLCYRASEIVQTFNSQELAQVLWAYAELSQPADPLLYALDCIFVMLERRQDSHDEYTLSPTDSSIIKPFGNASAEHLANVAWSYTVLNQIKRPSFKHFWRMLENCIAQDKDENKKAVSVWHLCQIYQVNLCLQYEYPQLGLMLSTSLKDIASEAWEKQKSNSSPSVYQKDVKWHLISMGQNWVAEYKYADYSLDFALLGEKIALEFDGPSHFIRNTGLPLGHTLLKRRLLASSGWRILPIPYAEWEELDGEAEQMEYLKQLLKR